MRNLYIATSREANEGAHSSIYDVKLKIIKNKQFIHKIVQITSEVSS